LPWTDDTGPVPHRTEEEFLALVRKKADAAAGRHRWQAGVAAMVVLLAGLASAVARGGPDAATELRTVGGGPVASTSPAPPTTATPTTVTEAASPTTTVSAPVTSRATTTTRARGAAAPTTTPTTVPPAPSTSLVCRNSDNPACGPFRWDPHRAPEQPMSVTVSATPASPRAGQAVTFRVTVDDPDGAQLVSRDVGVVDYGDGTPVVPVSAHRDCYVAHGPWTPGAPEPIHADLTFQHVYAAAGTYTATFTFRSLGDCTYGPSEATRTATVTVLPAA
jgi:hypothetical protein